ncbi:MAG TPA: alpha/beta hydrolase [Rhodocyclaceae bacterium]|nr:alpha/beta hydrolase [Rhodocyclaceae bacterium]HMV53840.1 alpha/beta hydrolase [Rhodocyclaceae bacterium]HNH11504.1 alpha/beta hydrolase [Rhodocyclaceae bacterium]
MEPINLRGAPFRHHAWLREAAPATVREFHALHVYIDHDGTPWLRRDVVSADPTPRNPLALRLMAQDDAPSLYLGRPCHFTTGDDACNPLFWTHHRYGTSVVDSMVRALRGFLDGRRFDRLVLVGYSGGGTLALLMADRMPEVASVVTVAGNLDIAGWAALHGYSPLAGSLDPMLRVRRAPPAREFHLVGGRDENVAAALAAGYAKRFPDATLIEVADFDHVCCWARDWRALLAGPSLRGAFGRRIADSTD